MGIRLEGVLTVLGILLGAVSVQATPITYDITLTAEGIGNVLPIVGISALPAGPFSASFSFDEGTHSLTAFSATVGSETWSLAEVDISFFPDPREFEFDAL